LIFGTNDSEWKAALLKDIDASQLPVHYGGTLADPDGNPFCTTKICMGGEVPRHYYMDNSRKTLPNGDVQELTIPARNKKTLEFDIRTVNSVIKWKFGLERGDIGFAIFRKDGDKRVDVLPSRRISCETDSIARGELICTSISTYVVEFDNSHSLLRSKLLWTAISVQS